MENTNKIIIELPRNLNINYAKVISSQAIEFELDPRKIASPTNLFAVGSTLQRRVVNYYEGLAGDSERLFFLNEVNNFLLQNLLVVEAMDEELFYQEIGDKKAARKETEALQYWIYAELQYLGFDNDQFTSDELNNLEIKIDKITEALDKLQGGQEILFDRIEEIKDDLKNVLMSVGLGKTPFKQRIIGIVAGYFFEKGADKVYETLRPLIDDFNFSKLLK